MKRLLSTGLLACAAFLSSCGGGGSPYVPTTPVNCSMPLQYADGRTSGVAMSPQALSADRVFATECKPLQVTAVTLTLCTDHPALAELSGQLWLAGTRVGQFALQDGTAQDNLCLANSSATTSRRQWVFAQPGLQGLGPLTGPWRVDITDTLQNSNNGYFVAWALDVQGVR